MDKKITLNFSYVSLTLYVVLALKALALISWEIQNSAWTFLVVVESAAIFFSLLGIILLSFQSLIIKTPLASKKNLLPAESPWWWFNHNFVIEWACVLIILFKDIPQLNLKILFGVFILRQFLFNFLMFKIRKVLKKLDSP